MKKRSGYLILAIILVVFAVVAFVAPFEKTPVFWVSFVFGLLAICFQIPLWNKALSGETLKSKFLGFPVLHIGIAYMIIQLIVSIIMMAVPGIPLWIAIIVDVVILAISCALVTSGGVARTAIEETEGKIQAKTSFIKSLKADVDILLSKETDSEVRDELRKLSDEIRFSDPMSNNALDNIEAEISDKLISVSAAGENKKNVISEISGLIKQRNIKCKALK
ncbi:hypothetical protein [Anaerolactibacter massiliensis]|jgi:hypothetical protein|uniref:hypothetical protein n=1 Tax=Anaerolactibacter massiliensis TaxID=2044573 RepID=UPI000CF9E05C|nr:hypothetical protein [Anaerolactibacter massiliensis]